MKKVIGFFQSLKLTVVLLALGMVLVMAGTLAQVEMGIWEVMNQYFRCFVAWIDLAVFFPRSWGIPSFKIPFPGGFLIGFLLSANLLAVHGVRFKVQAIGRRRIAGFLVLALGVLVTVGVMMGWGTASVATTQSDAFWRVFLRLGRGSVAAGVLYVACLLLYRRRAGMVLLHAGILFLLIGEFTAALFSSEFSMTIKEGATADFVEHSRQTELAFTDSSNPDFDTVTVVSQKKFAKRKMLKFEPLPCDVRIYQFRDPMGEIDIELFDRASGESLGRGVFAVRGRPGQVVVNGTKYSIALRPKREYLRSPSGHPYSIKLLDFVHEKYEGTQTPSDFSSHILLVNEGDHVERELRIWMNNPLRYARRTFYQSGFIPDNSGTILQVVRNDTWMIPYLACMIVFIGMTAQFVESLRRYLGKS